MIVHAGGDALLTVAAHGIGGHRDDADALVVLAGFALSDPTRRLEAVHGRHLPIHKDEVVVAPLQHLDRLGPIVGNRCADAELGQHLHGDLLIDGVIVDHENVGLVGKIECQRDDGGGIDGGRRHREGNPDGEGGAGTRGRGDLDVAAHQFGQTLADGEPETGAAELAGCGGIALGEGGKQASQQLRFHSHAGIGDGERQPGFVLGSAFAHERERDGALGGELDGVSDQVGQDLPQPPGIAFHRYGEVIVAGIIAPHAGGLQPHALLLRRQGKQGGDVENDLLR